MDNKGEKVGNNNSIQQDCLQDIHKQSNQLPRSQSKQQLPQKSSNSLKQEKIEAQESYISSSNSISQCLVCFDNQPDSVILQCGHGGIHPFDLQFSYNYYEGLCFSCAVDIWKKRGECHLCRQKIENVVQIDNNFKLGKYKKIIAVSKIQEQNEEVIPVHQNDISQRNDNSQVQRMIECPSNIMIEVLNAQSSALQSRTDLQNEEGVEMNTNNAYQQNQTFLREMENSNEMALQQVEEILNGGNNIISKENDSLSARMSSFLSENHESSFIGESNDEKISHLYNLYQIKDEIDTISFDASISSSSSSPSPQSNCRKDQSGQLSFCNTISMQQQQQQQQCEGNNQNDLCIYGTNQVANKIQQPNNDISNQDNFLLRPIEEENTERRNASPSSDLEVPKLKILNTLVMIEE